MRQSEKVISVSQRSFNIEELKKIIPSDYLIVFFSPAERTSEIGKAVAENYPNSIGASSFLGISKDYEDYNSVNFLGIKFDNVEFALLRNVDRKIITYYKEVEALGKIYRRNHSVLLEFTDGLTAAEESVLTVLTNELPEVPVIGGSAADGGTYTHTKVCVNGECYEGATALCMLTTPMEIEVYCENIYEPTDIKAVITDSDLFGRKINKINGKPAADFYCQALNISKQGAKEEFIKHPIARIIGDRYFITSIKSFDNGSLDTYARCFNHSYISICNPKDYLKLWEEKALANRNKYLGGIFINCAFRTNLFQSSGTMEQFKKYLESFGEFLCMTSYGEQFYDSHANQTMTACLFK